MSSKWYKKKLGIGVISLFLTSFLFIFVLALGQWSLTKLESSSWFYENPNHYYFSIHMSTTGPSYFFPFESVSASLSNPYAEEIKGFWLFMSTDNSTWIEIPLSGLKTEFGKILVNNFNVDMYAKCYFPPQNTTTPKTTILQSFNYQISGSSAYTPQSLVLLVLVYIAVFSFILKIVEFILK